MWGDDLQELLGLHDYGPAIGTGEEFRGWDAYYFDVPAAPAPVALRAPAAAPGFAPIAPAASPGSTIGDVALSWLEGLALPAVASRPTYRAEPASAEPEPAPLFVRLTKPTWFNTTKGTAMETDPGAFDYGDWQKGPPLGPYYLSPEWTRDYLAAGDYLGIKASGNPLNLPSARDYPRQVPSNPLQLSSIIPRLTLPAALTNPGGASLSALLVPMALALLAVVALRK